MAAFGAALFLRLHDLSAKPFHADEAVQAFKTFDLYAGSGYRYDPADHHGPALYYLAQPFLSLSSAKTLADLDEKTFRHLPAFFGAATVLLLFLFRGFLPDSALIFSAFLLAVSPFMVFFSRTYIQESLLVFFTLATVGCFLRSIPSPLEGGGLGRGWLLLSGLSLGFMISTKETWVLTAAALFITLPLTGGGKRERVSKPEDPDRGQAPEKLHRSQPPIGTGLLFLFPASLVCLLLYSSFSSHPRGLFDAFQAYFQGWNRLRGGTDHDHGFLFYFWTLRYESLVPILGLISLLIPSPAEEREGLGRRLLVFTLSISLFYSLIPYKTPWSFLCPWAFWILLAGLGFSRLPRRAKALALLIPAHLAWKGWDLNIKNHSSPRNPLVYSGTSPDLAKLQERIEGIFKSAPRGSSLLIKVYGNEIWPLPWALRSHKRVGYWPTPQGDADADLVIARMEDEPMLEKTLKNAYRQEFFALRHGVLLTLRIAAP